MRKKYYFNIRSSGSRIKNCKFSKFQNDIFRITEEQNIGSGIYFLEGSKEKELAYLEHAVYRWYDLLKYTMSNNSIHSNCLDIGVTPFTFYLKNIFETVNACDLSSAFKARCDNNGITLYSGGVLNDEDIIPNNYYDFIFMLEVIEHIHKNPIDIINYLYNKLRNNGILIITTPNMMILSNRYRMLINKKLNQFDYPPFQNYSSIHGSGHDRIFMPKELIDYFNQSNFNKYYIDYSNSLGEKRFKEKNKINKILNIPNLIIKQLIPSTRDTIVFIAKKTC